MLSGDGRWCGVEPSWRFASEPGTGQAPEQAWRLAWLALETKSWVLRVFLFKYRRGFCHCYLLKMFSFCARVKTREKAYLKCDGSIVCVYLSVFIREMTLPRFTGKLLVAHYSHQCKLCHQIHSLLPRSLPDQGFLWAFTEAANELS